MRKVGNQVSSIWEEIKWKLSDTDTHTYTHKYMHMHAYTHIHTRIRKFEDSPWGLLIDNLYNRPVEDICYRYYSKCQRHITTFTFMKNFT